jgi:hypothetical protein
MPSGSGMGSLDWESCGDLIFPNITSDLNEPEDPIDDVDELLPDLITEDELEDINFSEMGLTDGMFKCYLLTNGQINDQQKKKKQECMFHILMNLIGYQLVCK